MLETLAAVPCSRPFRPNARPTRGMPLAPDRRGYARSGRRNPVMPGRGGQPTNRLERPRGRGYARSAHFVAGVTDCAVFTRQHLTP